MDSEVKRPGETFNPLSWTLGEIRDAIPPPLFIRNTRKALAYAGRDYAMAALWWTMVWYFETLLSSTMAETYLGTYGAFTMKWVSWCIYWWIQGLTFTGIWVIGHECGHGAFSDSRLTCDIVGFVSHTLLLTPYFSWRISHHRHHYNHASIERDEVYVPKTRGQLGIPKLEDDADSTDYYEDFFGDTPLYTLAMLISQQLFAFPAYLVANVSGQLSYPKWTNHFDPRSVLFNKSQRNAVIISNLAMITMITMLISASSFFGFNAVLKYYLIPWLCVSHWFVMITYLHHTEPTLPHYRDNQWNFQRGAAATVDRNFLGWQGRFFLHDVAHFHVVHHFFPQMPWYNGEQATKHLKEFLGEHYHFSDKPVFEALWTSYNQCQFVEDTGSIVFYKNKQGKAMLPDVP